MYLVHKSACGSCRSADPPIPGDGPTPARVLFIGEGPAKEEAKRRQNFVGPAGKEYNYHYLPLAGLCRPDVFTTNATHCPMPDFRNPTNEEAAICAGKWLPRELREVNPEVVVPMGAVACSLFDPPIDLELDHGMPRWGSYRGWEGILFPMYHPAAGIHNPDFYMGKLREDFQALGNFLRTGTQDLGPADLDLPDAFPSPFYAEADQEMIRISLDGPDLVAIDTEHDQETGTPLCATYSTEPGSGFLIHAGSPEMELFSRLLSGLNPLVLLHGAPHDLPILARMGVLIKRFRCTQQMAYHLGIQQSLKVLAHRLCGMRMKEYEEVVYPPSKILAFEYLSTVSRSMSADFLEPVKRGKRAGQLKRRDSADPTHVGTLRKAQKAANDPSCDPWKRWAGWHEHDRELIRQYAHGASIPQPSLLHVPHEDMLYYSVRDADATLRIYPELQRLSREFRRRIS